MKHKLIAAPLLSLTLVIFFFRPLGNSDLPSKSLPKLTNQLAPSGLTAEITPAATPSLEAVATPLEPATIVPVIIPSVTATPVAVKSLSQDLHQFIAEVSDGQPEAVLRGVHVDGILALRVIQQPEDNPTYVAEKSGIATQFKSAETHGVTGLLAHNYLSGALYYNLEPGEEVHLVYSNGTVKYYQVNEIQRFQKLTPASLRSDLVDLSTGQQHTTAEVFRRFYTGGDHVTFQTCLASKGLSNWGLVFIVAVPIH